jgi:voltage-gated potassium channel Kch
LKQPLLVLSLCLHFVWLAVLVVLFAVATETAPNFLARALASVGMPSSRDAIALAADLGRLDIVSLSLTILGAVLALAALGSYFVMRHTVIQTTREEAAAAIPKEVKSTVTIDLLIQAIKSDPVLLDQLQGAVREGAISDTEADDIAEAMDDNNE